MISKRQGRLASILAAGALTFNAWGADVKLAWDGIAGPAIYVVQLKPLCGGEFTEMGRTTQLTFTLTNVTGLALARVIAIVDGVQTGPSNWVLIQP